MGAARPEVPEACSAFNTREQLGEVEREGLQQLLGQRS